MKILKKNALQLLSELKFDTTEWSDEKIILHVVKAPSKISESRAAKLTPASRELFNSLQNWTVEDKVVLVDDLDEDSEETPKDIIASATKSKKKKSKSKAAPEKEDKSEEIIASIKDMGKAEIAAFIDENDLGISVEDFKFVNSLRAAVAAAFKTKQGGVGPDLGAMEDKTASKPKKPRKKTADILADLKKSDSEETPAEVPTKPKKPSKKKPAAKPDEDPGLPPLPDPTAAKTNNAVERKTGIAPRDFLGSRPGSMSNLVNEVLSVEWQTEEEIVKQVGSLKKDQVMSRIYLMVEQGKLEKESVRRYRLSPEITATSPKDQKAGK